MANERFLGSGMKFPPKVDPSTGRFVISAGEQSVKESVYLILMTQRGERWLEPLFGARLLSYSFMDTSPTMLGLMKTSLPACCSSRSRAFRMCQLRLTQRCAMAAC